MRKPRLLWISDINCNSGFGMVAENVLKYLQAKYEIVAAGWNFDPRQEHKKPWKYYYLHKEPTRAIGVTMDMVMDGVTKVANDVKPDIIMCYADPWNFPYVCDEFTSSEGKAYMGLRKMLPNTKIVGYLTADAKPLPTWIRKHLINYDNIAVPSDFSKESMQLLIPNTPIDVIYHGINTDVFYPRTQDVVKQVRQQLGIAPNDFVIGFNGRNQFRKNLPALFRTFRIFKNMLLEKNITAGKFLLMTDFPPNSTRFELQSLINRLGLAQDVIIPGGFGPHSQYSDDQIALFYSCMDVYMSLVYCEGFGLPVLEAMACGVPVLHTGYSAPVELINKSCGGELVDVVGYINEKNGDRNFAVANEEHAAGILYDWFNKPEELQRLSSNASKWACKQTWLKAAKQFDNLLARTLQQPSTPFFPDVFSFEVLDAEVI